MDGVRKKSLRELLPKEEIEPPKKAPGRRKKIVTEHVSGGYFEDRGSSRAPLFWWSVSLIVLLVAAYYVSIAFASVTVKITPRQATIDLAGEYEANLAPAAGGIEYSVMKLEETDERDVPATGQRKVEKKASGTVAIYNYFSTSPQKLAAGTRLETKNGLIFRLNNAVTVPGFVKSGKVIKPGTVSVAVTAAAAGPSYNIGTADLKIVGFKGSAKYEKFQARSERGIAGGKSETESIVDEEAKSKTAKEMEEGLKAKVTAKAKLQIPKDFIMFDDGVFITYDTTTKSAGTTTSRAVVTTKATLTAILFNGGNLSRYFAERDSQIGRQPQLDQNDEPIRIANSNEIVFKLSDKDKMNLDQAKQIKFSLNGQAKLIWPVSPADLKKRLVGTPISEKDKVFAENPSIYRAEAVVRPPWLMSFPADSDSINVRLMVQ